MMKALEKNPNEFVTNGASSSSRQVNANGRFIDAKKKGKSKRSRKKVDRPKQTYVYASQRRALEELDGNKNNGKMKKNNGDLVVEDGEYNENIDHQSSSTTNPKNKLGQQQQQQQQAQFVRTLGLNPTNQVADPIIGNSNEDVPRIIGSIRVDGLSSSSFDDDDDDDTTAATDDENEGTTITATTITSNSFAYVLYKPVGWSILGEKKKINKNKTSAAEVAEIKNDEPTASTTTTDASDSISSSDNDTRRSKSKRVKAYDEQLDDFTYVEYNEADVLSVLTPEERAELLKEGGLSLSDDLADIAKDVLAGSEWDDGLNDDNDGLIKNKKMKKTGKKRDQNGGVVTRHETQAQASSAAGGGEVPRSRTKANLNNPTRPSLVSWLKELKSNEGTPIKGGKNWVALSGATEIDDSGLVLLCPRDQIHSIHVDQCEYIAVVGNGKKLVSRSKLLKSKSSSTTGSSETYDDSTVQIDILSRIKRGRDTDPILSVSVNYPDGSWSTCSHAVLLCQNKFGDGVRGDALADPLDRRASRRLVHCTSMTVTSLANLDDDPVVVEGCDVPDDIANYANRRDGTMFTKGSFLGRQGGLAQNGLTNAYREVNGATDGYPGWTVDRYDQWLFVQQEEGSMSALGRGPLPSLHDGYTSGVYYLQTKADRSVMGSEKIKPTLLEGKAAPEFIPIMENGITYLVNMGDSYSTGIFLDQRLQRAWLSEVCNEDTRVLNCFAHTGAFSVAAATSGAKTVSLDLDKKWLDRIQPQMEANGIVEWEGHHDCIYGDCKYLCNNLSYMHFIQATLC